MGDIKITVKVKGKEKAIGVLEKIQKKLEDEALMKALAAGADVYVQGAKDRAPYKTGKLKKSIHKKRAKGGSRKGFEIGPTEDLIPIYASVQEFGATTRPSNEFVEALGGIVKRPGKIPANRYMQRTFDGDTEKAYKAFKEELFRDWPS